MTSEKPKIDVIAQLIEVSQAASLCVIKDFTRRDDLVLKVDFNDRIVNSYWMTLILMAFGGLRITFKTQFQSETIRKLAFNKWGNAPSVDLEKCIDFMKEYCNQTAGLIKRHIITKEFTPGISLPIQCEGFDELFFHQSAALDSARKTWAVGVGGDLIYCSISIEVLIGNDLKDLSIDLFTNKESTQGGVEFL